MRKRPLMVAMAAWVAGMTSVVSCGDDDGDERVTQQRRRPATTASVITPPSTAAPTTSPGSPTTATAEARLTSASRLRMDGIGPVRVGMTTDEASRVTGKRIRVGPNPGSPYPASCAFARPEGGPDIAFMVIDGRIRRVDVAPPSSVATVSGVRIGDPEAEVHRVYGARIRVQPHPYDPGGRYLLYDSPEPSQQGLLLIFETDGTRVTSFRAGERSAVELPEGCA